MSKVRVNQVLYVENSEIQLQFLINEHKKMNKSGLPLIITKFDTAQSIEEANQKIDLTNYDALILDMMLPEDHEALNELNDKERQREEKWKEYRKVIANDKNDGEKEIKTKTFRKEFNKIDDEIDELLNLEGGYVIAQHFKNRMKDISIPIIFFTAREEQWLIDKCKKLIGDKSFVWVSKPATPDEIFSYIYKFYK